MEIFVSKTNGITFEDAVKQANEKRNDCEEIVILLGEGEFYRKETIELTKNELKSGKAKVIFRGTGDKKTVISGGIALDYKDFEIAKNDRIRPEMQGRILSIDLKKYGIKEVGKPFMRDSDTDISTSQAELFVDDEEANIVTFPKNKKRLKFHEKDVVRALKRFDSENYPNPYDDVGDISDRCAIFKYNCKEADNWGKAHDAYMFGYPGAGFFSYSVPVDIDTKNKTINLKDMIDIRWGEYCNTYSICNLLEELTEKGEYYIDSNELILYYYPKKPFTRQTKIRLSNLKAPLLACEDIFNVQFENIVFECTRDMGVYLENTKHVTFEDCIFRNIGTVAVDFGKGFKKTSVKAREFVNHNWTDLPFEKRTVGNIKTQMLNNPMTQRDGGYDNLILNCEIYNIGCGGIILDGGDRMNLLKGNNRVVGCDIHDFNRLEQSYRPGIGAFGCGNVVSYCKIYNAPQQGYCATGNDNVIEYCEIYNCCKDNFDNGAIYCGSAPAVSRNSFNTIIQNNYFHHNGAEDCTLNEGARDFRSETYDIYLDGHPGTTISGNIFKGSAVHSAVFVNKNSQYDTVVGNIFIDVNGVFHREKGTYSYDPYSLFNMTEKQIEKWKKTYPQMQNYVNMEDNIELAQHRITNNTHIGEGDMIICSSNVYKYEQNVHYDKMPKYLKELIEKLK